MPTDYQLTCGTKTRRFMTCQQTSNGLQWELKVVAHAQTHTQSKQWAVLVSFA